MRRGAPAGRIIAGACNVKTWLPGPGTSAPSLLVLVRIFDLPLVQPRRRLGDDPRLAQQARHRVRWLRSHRQPIPRGQGAIGQGARCGIMLAREQRSQAHRSALRCTRGGRIPSEFQPRQRRRWQRLHRLRQHGCKAGSSSLYPLDVQRKLFVAVLACKSRGAGWAR